MNTKYRFLLLLLVVLAVYARSLTYGYVNYDDKSFVTQPTVVNFDLKTMFTSFQNHDFIPVTLLSFAVEQKLVHEKPWFSHGINLLLHILNLALLYFLLRKWQIAEGFVFLVVGIWAVHPLNVESVVWVSERKGLLSALFLLLSVYTIPSELTWRKWGKPLILWFVAVLAKPVALPFLFFFVLWRQFLRKKNLPVGLPFFAEATLSLSVIGLVFYMHLMARESTLVKFDIEMAFKALVGGLSFYFSKSIAPTELAPFYSTKSWSLSLMDWIWVIVFFIPIVSLYRRGIVSKKVIGLALFFFIWTILPQLKLVPFGLNFVFADRYFYLAGLGLIFFIALDLYAIPIPKFRELAGWMIILTYAYMSFEQTEVWSSSHRLWDKVLERDAQSSVAHNNKGLLHLFYGHPQEAQKSFEQAVLYDPLNNQAWYNLSVTLDMLGDPSGASIARTKAFTIDPRPEIYRPQ